MGIARCKIRIGLNSVPSVYAEFGLPEAHRRALRRGSVDPSRCSRHTRVTSLGAERLRCQSHPRTATRVLASPRPAFRAAPPAPAPRAHRNHELFLGQRAISLNLALIYAISCGRQSNWIDAGRAAAEKASQEPRRRQGGSLAGKAAEGYCHGELLLAARARSRDTRARCASRADPSRFAARRILPRSVREMHSQLQPRQQIAIAERASSSALQALQCRARQTKQAVLGAVLHLFPAHRSGCQSLRLVCAAGLDRFAAVSPRLTASRLATSQPAASRLAASRLAASPLAASPLGATQFGSVVLSASHQVASGQVAHGPYRRQLSRW